MLQSNRWEMDDNKSIRVCETCLSLRIKIEVNGEDLDESRFPGNTIWFCILFRGPF